MTAPEKAVILLVEDDLDVLKINRKWLARAGFEPKCAQTLAAARSLLKDTTPELVVLDINLPDGDGLAFLPELRSISDAPVLFLSGRNEANDILLGLKAGGDDYLPKPYSVDILLAKVEILLRKAQQLIEARASNDHIIKDALMLDMSSLQAFLYGKDLCLAHKEFALLRLFIQNEDKIFSSAHLYHKVWGAPAINDNTALKTAVSRLRSKLEGSGYTISYQRSDGGYCFKNDAS